MTLAVSYSGPALAFYQGALIDARAFVTGSFRIRRESHGQVLLDSGEHDGRTYVVPRREFDARAIVYH